MHLDTMEDELLREVTQRRMVAWLAGLAAVLHMLAFFAPSEYRQGLVRVPAGYGFLATLLVLWLNGKPRWDRVKGHAGRDPGDRGGVAGHGPVSGHAAGARRVHLDGAGYRADVRHVVLFPAAPRGHPGFGRDLRVFSGHGLAGGGPGRAAAGVRGVAAGVRGLPGAARAVGGAGAHAGGRACAGRCTTTA